MVPKTSKTDPEGHLQNYIPFLPPKIIPNKVIQRLCHLNICIYSYKQLRAKSLQYADTMKPLSVPFL